MHLPFEELESILQALISNGLQLLGKTQQNLNLFFRGRLRKKDKAFPTQGQESTKQQVSRLEARWGVCICVCVKQPALFAQSRPLWEHRTDSTGQSAAIA